MNMRNEVFAFYKEHGDKIRMEFQEFSGRLGIFFSFRVPYDTHLGLGDVYEDIQTEEEPEGARELRAAFAEDGVDLERGFAITHGGFFDFQKLFRGYQNQYVAEVIVDRTISRKEPIGFLAAFKDLLCYGYPLRDGYTCEDILVQVAYVMSKTFTEFYDLTNTRVLSDPDDDHPTPDILKHTSRVWKPNTYRVFEHRNTYSAREGRGEITFTFRHAHISLLELEYFDTDLTRATSCRRDGNILRCAYTAQNEFRALRIDEDVCDAFAQVLCLFSNEPLTHELFDHPTYSWNLELPDVLPLPPTSGAPKPKLSLLQKLRSYFRLW